jgi:hypothetical protein
MSYSITYNGLTITEASENYIIHRVDGLDGLDIRTSQGNLLGRDGGNIWEQKYSMRTIGLEVNVIANTVAEYYAAKRALVAAFSKQDDYKLFTLNLDGNVRYILAKIITMPMIVERDNEPSWCDVRIELKSADPFIYNENPTSLSPDITLYLAEIEGFDIPFDIPFDIEGGTGNLGIINNAGDIVSYADIKIYGGNPVLNPNVTNLTTGEGFTINTSITAGNYVHIFYDTEGFKVLLNDVANYYQYFIGEHPTVALGDNTFSFTASAYESTAKAEISFFDKLLSI